MLEIPIGGKKKGINCMKNTSDPIHQKTRFLGTTRVIALGFALVILAGALLLTLPISSATGQWTSFIDALFTATTSVCVTGLVTVTTATYWSLFGHIVILILIQLGGLGIICCGMAIMLLIGRRMGLKERMLIKESYGITENIDISRILKGTFIIEGIGAILLGIRFIPKYGLLKGVWYSVFHSVSAFCNAGIDVLGENSLCDYRNDPLVALTICGLIALGGIGFVVWWDVHRVLKNAVREKRYKNMLFSKLTLHSKVAITMTFVLIIIGTVTYYIVENDNPSTMGNESLGGKILMSIFQAITPRTAGYFTMPQEGMRDPSYIVTVVLMLIGGSPMGTAGGFKTTTVAMIVACAISVILGRRETEMFNRRVAVENLRAGIAVITISVTALLGGVILMTIIEPFSIRAIVFEEVSAIATVGLGYGITPFLSVAGKLILIFLMYIGRIGPITIGMALGGKKNKVLETTKLAEKKIIVG